MEQITINECLKDQKIETLKTAIELRDIKIQQQKEEIQRLKEIIKYQSFGIAGIPYKRDYDEHRGNDKNL